MKLLVRNRVRDFEAWLAVYESDTAAREAGGIHAMSLWTNADDPTEVFFVMDVEDRGRAETFMATPEAKAKGEEAGVLDGDYWFLNEG